MDKMRMQTSDLTQTNIEKLAALFPACITEARGADGKLKKAVNRRIHQLPCAHNGKCQCKI